MSKVKLHEDIKVLDKAKDFSKHMKHSYVKTKEKAEENHEIIHDTPHTYATDSISAKVKELSNTTAFKVEHLGRRSLKKVPETVQGAKTEVIRIKQRIHNTAKNIKIKGTVKNARKTVVKTAKASKRTAQTSAKAVQASMKASQKAAQAAKVATKTTVQTVKATAKAVIAAVKATVAAVKGLITIIAAGGWVAIVVILIICMVAFLISSPFGIFYTSDKTDPDSMTITTVIEQINQDFTYKIERIKSENPHDEVDGIATPQNWKDVLAVYAVKYSTDPKNPIEVATIDSQKYGAIKSVFGDMNSISFTIETIEPKTVSEGSNTSAHAGLKTILHITVKNKSCSEMAAQYAFNSEQYEQLNELMSDNFKSTWSGLLE